MEIAQKIVHAIKRNERFAAYIVLPLHPDTEGFSRCRASCGDSKCTCCPLPYARSAALAAVCREATLMPRMLQHCRCALTLGGDSDCLLPCRDALLYFQRHTVQMMYHVVGQALLDAKSDLHPRDYLNFFCLATVQPDNEQHRKSYIYVHAKVSASGRPPAHGMTFCSLMPGDPLCITHLLIQPTSASTLAALSRT